MKLRQWQSNGDASLVNETAEWAFVHDQPPDMDGFDERTQRAIKFRELHLRASLLRDGTYAAEVWERYRPRVMKEWPRQFPGTRPDCWWKFDSPLRRLPLSNPLEAGLFRFDAEWETQASYLNRHGLLSALERATLPHAAYEPAPLTVVTGDPHAEG